MRRSLLANMLGLNMLFLIPSRGKNVHPLNTVQQHYRWCGGHRWQLGGQSHQPPPCCQFTPGVGETECEIWEEHQVAPGLGASCLALKQRRRGSTGWWAASRDSGNQPSENSATQLKVKSGCSLKQLSNLCGGDS